MPVNSRLSAIMIQDQLTLCLTKVIEKSMYETLGQDWYFLIREEDIKASSSKNPPILEGISKIEHCDFQSLLKLMAFRENIRQAVIETWKIDYSDTNKGFYSLLRQLMTYRNNNAHNNAEEIGRELAGKASNRILDTNRSITDMVKLAMIFKDVKNDKGVSYYEVIRNIRDDYEKGQRKKQYSVKETLKKEKLNVTTGEFIDIVYQYNIEMDVFDSENGDLCFATEDYDVIVEKLRYRQHHRKSLFVLITAVFMAIVLVIMVLFVIPFLSNKSYNEGVAIASVSVSNKLYPIKIDKGIIVFCESIDTDEAHNQYKLSLKFMNISDHMIHVFNLKKIRVSYKDTSEIIAAGKDNSVVSVQYFVPSKLSVSHEIVINGVGKFHNVIDPSELDFDFEII